MNFSAIIIEWYHHHHRELPWRNTQDPYIVWLSEIILQQTRVEQGKPYFYRFLEKFPSVEALAAADEEVVLRLWQGLGYYSRARNMHKTAKHITDNLGNKFPKNYKDLKQLKGVGAYTAAAIASFCFEEPVAVIDGNVFRVLSRYFGVQTPINTTDGVKEFSQLANQLLDISHPGIHNQAIMEFGALQCKPQSPNCSECPLAINCFAFRHQQVALLPQKQKKLQIKQRYLYYIAVISQDAVLLRKRKAHDIWANMFDFIGWEQEQPMNNHDLYKELNSRFQIDKIQVEEVSIPFVHKLTHRHLTVQFIKLSTTNLPSFQQIEGLKWYTFEEAEQLPKPKIIFEYLKTFF